MSDRVIKIVIDSREAKRGANEVENSLGRVGNAASGLNGKLSGLAGGLTRIGPLMAALAGSAAIAGLGRLSDEAKKLSGQLALVEGGLSGVAAKQKELVELSLRTGTAIGANTELYTKMKRALRDTVGASGDYVRATETVAKAMAVSNTSAGAAAGAIAQLGQALASGTLRGDEFNSVNEAAPRLMELLAASLGKPVGALRKMAEEGQLTSDKLYSALTDPQFTAKLDEEFGQLPMTFGRAMENIQTLATFTFGKFDEGGEFSNSILGFADTSKVNFEEIGQAAYDLGAELSLAFGALSDALSTTFDPLLDNAISIFDAVGIEAKSIREEIADVLGIFDDLLNLAASPYRLGRRHNAYLKGGEQGVREYEANNPKFDMRGEYNDAYGRRMAEREARRREREQKELDRDVKATLAGGGARGAIGGGADKDGERAAKKAQREREQAAASLKERLSGMEREVELAGMATAEAQRQREMYELRELALSAGVKLDEQRVRHLQEQKAILDGAADAMRLINDLASQPLNLVSPDEARVLGRYSKPDEYDFSARSGRTLADANQIFERDRRTIMLGNIPEGDRADMLADLEKKQAEVAKEFEARHLDAISNIASAFGGQMGDAVNKVVGILKSINEGDFDGTQLGGVAGGIAGIANMFTKGKFAKDVGDKVKKAFDINELKNPLNSMKKGFGEFSANLKGGNFSAIGSSALAGVQQGEMVNSIMKPLGKALGVKTSKLGSQIGGGIGNAVGGPIGGFIGASIGSVVGGLFKKTAKASASLGSVSAYGEIDIAKATGSKKLRETVDNMASAFESSLKNIQALLGADLAGGTGLGTLDAKGKKLFFTSPGGSKQTFKDSEEAVEAALKDALGRGVLKGISDFSQRVLRAATDLDRAAELAGRYETVMRELALLDDPIGGPLKELTKEFEKLSGQMKDAGATAGELANVERYYSLKRKELLDDSLSDLMDFKKSLSGEGSGVTALNRLNSALSEFAGFERDIAAGKTVDQAKFTEVGQSAFALGREVYGTATSEFQSIRSRLMSATGGAMTNATASFNASAPVVSAVEQQTATLVQRQEITNELLRQLIGTVANNGTAPVGGRSGYVNGQRVDVR